jgi:protein-tyrosine sulfotransferase
MGHIPASARPDPLFVMCEARSGSTLLRFLLGAHPDVACPSETNLPALCHEMVNVWSLMTGHPAPGRLLPSQHPVLPDEVLNGLRASIDLMMSAHLERVGKTWFCDKSLGSAMHAKLLLQLYPNPMDVIASGLEACPWGLVGYGFDPYIAATPGNSVLALARFWLERIAQIMSVEEDFPDQCLRVRYEDLVSDPDRVMSEVFRHLGIPPMPDIASRCFRSEPENLGAADYKIWYTNKITSDSVGRGWKIPANLITPPIIEGINELSERLGYLPIHPDAWGVGTPPPDVCTPAPGSMPAPGSGVPSLDDCTPPPAVRIRMPAPVGGVGTGVALRGDAWRGTGASTLVATALRDRIGTGLSEWALSAGQEASAASTFHLGVFPDESQSRAERPALLAVDLSEGAADIIDPFTTGHQLSPPGAWELLGSAGTWRRILDGEVNLGVALRRSEVRYRGESSGDDRAEVQSEPEHTGAEIQVNRVEVQRRISMVSRLLGCTSWQPS